MSYNRTKCHYREASLPNGAHNDQTYHQIHYKVHYLKYYHTKTLRKITIPRQNQNMTITSIWQHTKSMKINQIHMNINNMTKIIQNGIETHITK